MLKTTFTGKSRLAWLLCLTGLLSFAATNVRADEDGYNGQDPPSRVARMSSIDGSVSLQSGGQGDWGAAARNRPVTVGDKLWVDKGARAELQAGQASIHIGGLTALSFLNLDQNITQMRLAEGSLNFRVRELREGDQYEVDTPNAAFTVRQAGAFHIDVNENGDGTRITVLRGDGEVTAGGRTYDVHQGERAEFNGTDGNVEYNTERAPGEDDLDRWASERDLREERSVSARYVSRDTVGYSDLDDYGDWDDVPEYGHVWYPRSVDVGWAPYSYGAWNWVGPWGWTWVDDSPWGFAPFHYGRWNQFGDRWGWCPGPIGGYPIYGPAFVGFLGGGYGGGFGFGGGFGYGGGFSLGIGWFPLGYGEVYHPWYGAGSTYIHNININNTYINNTTIINNNVNSANYAYAHNPAAVTATSHNNFVNGQLVNRGATRVTAASLKGVQVTNRVALTPTKQSFTGPANGHARVATPPVAVQNRAVIARTAPAAAASHLPVRTVSTGATATRNGTVATNGRAAVGTNAPTVGNNRAAIGSSAAINGNNNRATVGNNRAVVGNNAQTTRDRQLSLNRPPSAQTQTGAQTTRPSGAYNNNRVTPGMNNNTNRPNATSQNAYPNRASNQPANNSAVNNSASAARVRADRPAWAGSGSNPSANTQYSQGGNRSTSNYNNRPPSANTNGGRSYNDRGASSQRPFSSPSNQAPQRQQSASPRSYSSPDRGYAAPQRSNAAPSRSYSAPSSRSYDAPQRQSSPRAYSAPDRGYSAPSRQPSPRAYSAPERSYSAPQQRSYSAPQQRSYSAPPQRSYSAPAQRSYSAPSQSGGGSNNGANPHSRH